MSTNRIFFDRIATVKKHVLVSTINQIVLMSLCCFFSLYTIVTVIEKVGGFSVRDHISFYVIALGMSLASALGYAYVTRERFPQTLIDIDTRLHLQDRLSTAYEYSTLAKPSPFAHLLLNDAEHTLNKLSPQQLFPSQWSLLHLLLGILIVINLALFVVDRLFPTAPNMTIDRATADTIKHLLQQYESKRPEAAKQAKPPEQQQVRDKLQDLAKQLDEQKMTRNDLLKSVDSMLQEVQSTQTELAKDLNAKLLDIQNFQNMPIQQIPQIKNFSLQDLQRFRQSLNDRFDNQIPESLEYDLDQLQQQTDLQELLRQMQEGAQSDQQEGQEFLSADNKTTAPEQQDQGGKEENSDRSNQRTKLPKSEQDQQENTDKGNSRSRQEQDEATGHSKEGQSGGKEEQSEQERPELEEGTATAGREKGGDTRQAPSPLEQAEGPTVQDKTKLPPQDDYRAYIRALTATDKATVPETEVTRPYQQELESILQKEDIPINYREYIKNYFLSIGLTQPKRE